MTFKCCLATFFFIGVISISYCNLKMTWIHLIYLSKSESNFNLISIYLRIRFGSFLSSDCIWMTFLPIRTIRNPIGLNRIRSVSKFTLPYRSAGKDIKCRARNFFRPAASLNPNLVIARSLYKVRIFGVNSIYGCLKNHQITLRFLDRDL